ncbi:hypothetical protein GMORB2_1846 [Geosmithia morbida]|uniref:2EXR domain-containing protein n=1 Tax=Geosmithia morbida TaxID=1094350 RepID=A0A9P4YUV6_9HYPO|nr:uncharacterized protein GMORB2_1846 [Geosmithia morbida]KAF4121439.1 hypothetical protein GMORB2_1846 [Geosmithia morbida]
MARPPIVVDSSDESDESGRESNSSSGPGSLLIELEAEEVEGIASNPTGYKDLAPLESFTLFTELPPELRRQIWEIFCPTLAQKGRVIPVTFLVDPIEDRVTVGDFISLSQVTEPCRTLASVNRESREIVLEKFPDTLPLHMGTGDAVVRFNAASDIVVVHNKGWLYQLPPHISEDYFPVLSVIQNLAITYSQLLAEDWDRLDQRFGEIVASFVHAPHSSVQNVFISLPGETESINRRWAVSPLACQHRVRTVEIEPGLGEDYDWIYCWPDLQNHPTFSWHHVSTYGAAIFERLLQDHDNGVGVEEADAMSAPSDDETDTLPDEYESEGIDDDEIIEHESSSEDELVPRPISADESSDDEGLAGQGDSETVGHFSSPEPESESEPDRGASSVGDQGRQFKRKRRRVLDDSDDDVSDGEASRPAKAAKTHKTITISDGEDNAEDEDEDEDDVRSRKYGRSRRRRQDNISSDDNDDDEDEKDDEPIKPGRSRQQPQVVSSSDSEGKEEDAPSSSEGSSEEEEEEEEAPVRMTLAQRLGRFRDENPIPSDSNDSDRTSDQDSEDASQDDGDSEEEDDDDEGDVDRSHRRGGFFDDEADDTDDDQSDGGDDTMDSFIVD